jgi:DNA polymerase III subunit delta
VASPFEPILQAAARGHVSPAYLLLGEEVLLRQEFVSRLLPLLLPPGMEPLNLDVLSGPEIGAADLDTRCRTVPAFAPRRVVLLKEVDRLRADVWDALLAYLDAPVPTTCLICVAEKLDPGHRGLRRIDGAGKVLRFTAPRDEAARERHSTQWIRERARRQGKSLSPEAERLLLTLQGPDLLRLSQEIDKLCLFVGDEREIDLDAVERLVGAGRVRGIFELTAAVSRRDLAVALRVLRHLLNRGEEPLGLLGMLARQFRLLLRAKELLGEACPPADISRLLGVPRPFLPELLEGARASSHSQLEQGLTRLRDLDGQLKSWSRARPLYLELAVIDLCR